MYITEVVPDLIICMAVYRVIRRQSTGTAAPPFHDPCFQASVDGAHLECGDAAPMVMGVDQSGHYEEARAANDLVSLAVLQVVVAPHGFDHSISLQDRAIRNDAAAARFVSGLADNVLSTNQRCGHGVLRPG